MAFNVGAIVGEIALDNTGLDRGFEAAEKSIGSKSVALGTLLGNLASDVVRKVGDIVGSVTRSVVGFLGDASQKSIEFRNALVGLQSVAEKLNIPFQQLEDAAKGLTEDGLLTVQDAATGLKNLLASGFGLEESIGLMNTFKDSAAFGRQGALSFGEAVVSATEGVKNQNSVLVDNAGITKNLSVILKEAGFALQDLSDETKGAAAREALYTGLLKEGELTKGNAAKLTEELAGKQAKLTSTVDRLKAAIGDALNPVLGDLIDRVQPLVETTLAWFEAQKPEITEALADAVERLFSHLGLNEVSITEALGKGFDFLKRTIEGLPGSIDDAAGAAKRAFELVGKFVNVGDLVFNALKVAAGETLKTAGQVGQGVSDLIGTNTAKVREFTDGVAAETEKAKANVLGSLNELIAGGEDVTLKNAEQRKRQIAADLERAQALETEKRVLEEIARKQTELGAVLGSSGNVIINQTILPPVTTGREQYIPFAEEQARRGETGQRGGGPPINGETP